MTHECRKKPETKATCANCAGDHPASYRGCPARPKKVVTPAQPLTAKIPAPPPVTNIWEKRKQAAAAIQARPQPPPLTTPDVQSILPPAQLQQLIASITQTVTQAVLASLAGLR